MPQNSNKLSYKNFQCSVFVLNLTVFSFSIFYLYLVPMWPAVLSDMVIMVISVKEPKLVFDAHVNRPFCQFTVIYRVGINVYPHRNETLKDVSWIPVIGKAIMIHFRSNLNLLSRSSLKKIIYTYKNSSHNVQSNPYSAQQIQWHQ